VSDAAICRGDRRFVIGKRPEPGRYVIALLPWDAYILSEYAAKERTWFNAGRN
jgi:hypothetical protein